MECTECVVSGNREARENSLAFSSTTESYFRSIFSLVKDSARDSDSRKEERERENMRCGSRGAAHDRQMHAPVLRVLPDPADGVSGTNMAAGAVSHTHIDG